MTRKQLNNRTNSFKFIDYFSTVVFVLEVQGSKCFISTVHILIFDVVYNLSTIAYEFSIQVPCRVKCDFWISNPPNLGGQKLVYQISVELGSNSIVMNEIGQIF